MRNIFLPTGPSIATTSFSLDQGGMQLYLPRKLMQWPDVTFAPAPDDPWLRTYDREAVNLFFTVQEVLAKENVKTVQFRRMGKIYDVIFGPFDENTASALAKRTLGYEEPDFAEFFLRVAPKRQPYHYRLEMTSAGDGSAQQFVQVSLDINNVDMSRSLEPVQMEKVYRHASECMPKRLFEMLAPFKGA
jgi:hypothetical protein